MTFRKMLVFRLLGQDVQALHQRQARVDHRGELPGEDDDVPGPDSGAEGEGDALLPSPAPRPGSSFACEGRPAPRPCVFTSSSPVLMSPPAAGLAL